MTLKRMVDLMDVAALAKTLEDFSEATGFATVAVDAQGVPVTEMCAFTDFCRAIRQDPVRRTLAASSLWLTAPRRSIAAMPDWSIFRCRSPARTATSGRSCVVRPGSLSWNSLIS